MVVPATHEPSAGILGLRLALSPAALLDGLKRHWSVLERDGRELVACDPVRVHPRGSDAFNIEYALRLAVDGKERVQPVYGELAGDGAELRYQQLLRRLRKPRRGQLTENNADACIGRIPCLGVVLRIPGLDERLVGLKLFHRPMLLASELSQYGLIRNSEVTDVDAQLLGHRLGKRGVVRFRLTTRDPRSGERASQSLIAKLYKYYSDGGPAIATIMHKLREYGFGGMDFGIPKPLAHLPDWQILLMEDIPGTPIAELGGSDLTLGVVAAGRALAKLHRCPVRVGGMHSIDDEIALLTRWASLVSEVEPGLREPLTNGLASVTAGLRRVPARERSLAHRDFYDKQVLIARQRVVLIDFDTLSMSDPALDLGNFIAHLRFEKPQAASRLEPAFLEGYGPAPDQASIDAYIKSTLLRLACIHAFCARRRSSVVRALAAL